jgi:hypothetical protein
MHRGIGARNEGTVVADHVTAYLQPIAIQVISSKNTK